MANPFFSGKSTAWVAAILSVLALAGCGDAGKPAGPAGGAPPPQEVGYVVLKPQPVTLVTELPGRTSPFRIADVRPQVNGVLLKRFFNEGAIVHEGDQLYQIDAAPYQAAYDSASATLQHAQAALVIAKLTEERNKGLLGTNAVSKQDYDNAYATQQQAEADVASGQAAVETAHVNLVYCKVLAPITGRSGRSVTEGALVTANQTTPLVTVQQLDPIYVDIPQSTAVLVRLKRELESGQITNSAGEEAPVTLTLEDGSTYEQKGTLKFSEVTVDIGTGSVILRAEFPNPNQLLLPGMFVTAHLIEGTVPDGILAPQIGVTHNQKGEPTALVIGDDGKVEVRVIKTNRAIGDQWLVTDGLKAGDKVIIDGLQKAHPGAPVHGTEVPAEPAPSAPTAAK